MMDERERCLELLGLKPGASVQDIKAAYRDMAKVWHPDRFAHDPRLQAKAQNKLKEINEAYETLTWASSGRGTRAANASTKTTAANVAPTPRPTQPASGKSHWPLMFVVILCVVAAGIFLSPRLLKRDNSEAGQASASSQPTVDVESEEQEALGNRQAKKNVEKQKATAAASNSGSSPVAAAAATPMPRAIPTTTVTIDPTTGLLANASCPIKSSMTYVAGQEPHQRCNADHRTSAATGQQAETKSKSKLRSLADRVAAPARWLKDKYKESAAQDD